MIPKKLMIKTRYGAALGIFKWGMAMYAREDIMPIAVKMATIRTFFLWASIIGPRNMEIDPAAIPAILPAYPQYAEHCESVNNSFAQ